MDPYKPDTENQTSTSSDPKAPVDSQSAPATNHADKNSKKLLYAVAAVVGLLLILVVALVVALLNKADDNSGSNNSTSPESTQTEEEGSKVSERKIAKTVPLPNSEGKLELLIYEPVVNSSNVMVHYAIRNICDGCGESVSAYAPALGISARNAYLLDNEAGEKYNVIKDQDDDPLATSTCSDHLKPGERVECFIAFSKPSAGAEYSIYLGGKLSTIDGFKMPQ